MVYSILPKPLKDAKQPASLSNLSYELLLQILKDVPTPSVLKLREACKNAEPACNTVVSERRNTLYIHPSIGSLRKTLEIYNHPVFSQGVEEVVLLGNVDWRIIEEVHPGYRGGNNTEETNPIGRFSAWPLEFPRAKGLSEEDSNGLSGLSGFEFAYKPLIDALAKLPRLHKLSFAESGQKPGFNEVAQNTIDSHMHKYINSEHPARLKPMLRRTDANVLYNLLIIPKLKFTSLCLKTELPFTENVIGIYDYDRPQNLHEDFARAVSGLTHIELHVNLGWQNAGRHTLDNSLIECASDSLKSLKIVFVPDAAVRKASMGTVCNRILWQLPELHLPKLERFELALGEPPAGTSLATGHGNRHLRPTCQFFNLTSFLSRHRGMLTHLRFDNVIFVHDDGDHAGSMTYTADETTTMILDHLELYPGKLKQFDWIVNVIRHDRQCPKTDPWAPVGCKQHDCGTYVNAGLSTTTIEDMLEMVEGINIWPDEETRTWNFGEYVMQALEHMKTIRFEDSAEEEEEEGEEGEEETGDEWWWWYT